MAIGIVGSNVGYSRSIADNRFLKLTGGALTGTLSINNNTIVSSQPLSLTQTWNNAAVTFAGLQTNITDSASGNPSTLIDLRVGGTPLFRVFSKTGNVTTSGGVDTRNLWVTSNHINIHAFGGVRWTPTTDPFVTPDLILARDAADTLAQRNGTNAQTFRLYKTYSSSGANYERIDFRWDGDVAKIGTQRAGSGSARDLVLETDGTERVRVSAAGVFSVDGVKLGRGAGAVSSNTAVGFEALAANTTGVDNAVFGYRSMLVNTTGSGAVGFGSASLFKNTTGNSNTAIGNFALFDNVTGSENTALGSRALLANTGSYNTAVGRQSMTSSTSGNNNSAVGINSGRFIADGTTANIVTNSSVFLGANTKALADNQTNQIVIGYNATGLGSNTAVLGNDSITTTALKGNVGIGTTSPTAKIQVAGDSLLDGNVAVNGTAVQSNVGLIAARQITDPASPQIGISASRTIAVTVSNSQNVRGGDFNVSLDSSAFNLTGIVSGLQSQFQNSNTATVSNGFGIDSYAYQVGTGTLTNGAAGRFSIRNLNAAGVITNAYGAIARLEFNNGTITNTYGFYVGDLTSGTQTNTPYSFYASDSGSLNYFAGNVGIGTTTPAAKLSIVDTTLAGSGALSGSALDMAQTWNTTGAPTAIKLNVTDTASNAASLLMDLRVGGVSKMEVSKSGNLRVKSTSADGGSLGHAIGFDIGALTWGFSNGGANSFRFGILNDAHLYVTSAKQWRFAGTTNIGWAPTSPDGAADLLLARDGAAGTLAQRNGTNAQEFRLYGTYAGSGVDYERFFIKTNTAAATQIGVAASGTGAYRNLEFQNGGSTRMTLTSTGNIGIGTLTPSSKLDIAGLNTTGYNFNVGELVVQPYSSGNTLITANAYFNGSAYTRINTGWASAIQFYQGQMMTFGASLSTGAFTPVINFKSDYNGNVAIGGSITSTLGSYTGATLVALSNGNVGIGVLNPTDKLAVNGTISSTSSISSDSVSSNTIYGTSIQAGDFVSSNSNSGTSGSFTSFEGYTVTVENGLIVSII